MLRSLLKNSHLLRYPPPATRCGVLGGTPHSGRRGKALHLEVFQETVRALILCSCLLYLSSCGNTQEAEFYGDLLTTEGGLTLTRNEHPTGWEQKECFLCHHPDNIHQVDNVADLDLDLGQIQDLVERDGIKSCKACHGANGVRE